MGSRTSKNTHSWGAAFGLSILAVGLILSLGSYQADDPSFSTFSSTWHAPKNVLGYFGSWIADVFFQVFGYGAWFWPLLVVTALIRWLIEGDREARIAGLRWFGGVVLMLCSACLFMDLLQTLPRANSNFPPQGLMGIALSAIVRPFFGTVGSYLVVLASLWCFCMVWWESLPAHFVRAMGIAFDAAKEILPAFAWLPRTKKRASDDEELVAGTSLKVNTPEKNKKTNENESDEVEEDSDIVARAPVIRQTSSAPKVPRAKQSETSHANTDWQLPPLSLLESPRNKAKPLTRQQVLEVATKITTTLRSFEIDGEVTEISPGPIITMYEFRPGLGVRVQKILAASTDLALALGVPSVRIVAPIPGKSVAGIEVPNPDKEDIVLRDVYESTLERAKTLKVPLCLGKDGEGKPVVEDLSRMPHLLIGGATSMGKSVLVNSILTGLLCRFTPEEMRLIIVDPKLVEFKAFEDIPHLMLPIVNDAADASQALKWAVSETKRRYQLMQKYHAKNIEAYNLKVATITDDEIKEGQTKPTRFAYIVIIIDELAELVLTAKKDVEQSIVRLSQLARAAGIHLIMSTQRPSADVVTSLIKSNCPSRVALRVASAIDSRIILDCSGAEQLLGKGDMFFTNTGPMGLRRMQGAYVSDEEIEKICKFWREQGEPEYKDEILAPEEDPALALEGSTEGTDPLFAEVVEFAREKGKISTSLIQRKFQIGYTRAARIMEQLEARGLVGEAAAAGKPRDVIM